MGKVLLFIVTLALVGTEAQAQQQPVCPPPRSLAVSDSIKPDIAIVARVEARELRFNAEPRLSLQLSGCPQIDTSMVTLRTNLPKPVQPAVTYRNVVVDFRLNMKFVDLECYITGRGCPAPDSTRIR